MEWKVGDIVQLNPEHSDMWGGAFMVVEELKSWGGAQGYIDIPGQGRSYLRLKFTDGVVVGRVYWTEEEEDEETD